MSKSWGLRRDRWMYFELELHISIDGAQGTHVRRNVCQIDENKPVYFFMAKQLMFLCIGGNYESRSMERSEQPWSHTSYFLGKLKTQWLAEKNKAFLALSSLQMGESLSQPPHATFLFQGATKPTARRPIVMNHRGLPQCLKPWHIVCISNNSATQFTVIFIP